MTTITVNGFQSSLAGPSNVVYGRMENLAVTEPITRGPYLKKMKKPSLKALNKRLNSKKFRLIERAAQNTQKLTGRSRF